MKQTAIGSKNDVEEGETVIVAYNGYDGIPLYVNAMEATVVGKGRTRIVVQVPGVEGTFNARPDQVRKLVKEEDSE